MAWVFEITRRDIFEAWEPEQTWPGTEMDREDGFIHLSAGDQVAGTLERHYAGRDDLVLLWLPTDVLPKSQLRWERSRGGALFPHLYGPLRRRWVTRADVLRLSGGRHQLPPDLPR